MNKTHDHTTLHKKTSFFITQGQARTMTVLAYALIGFIAGLFTMTIISLYRYVIKSTHK